MSFIDICRFRFDKIEKSYMKESQIKKCALVNGREFEEKELNLSFKEWDELFSDSDNKYCDLINLYSHENELPYNSQDLRWDSEKVVLWHCCFGHSWEKRISEYTSRMQFYNPCPICRNQIPGLSPRILESSAELIIDTIQYYINYYKEENLGKLRTILEGECKQIKRILDEALDSHSSLWLNDANMPTQIRYYFIYPNGKQADIDMYICDRNGSVKEIYEFLYEGVISTDYKEEIELLYNSLLYNYRIG